MEDEPAIYSRRSNDPVGAAIIGDEPARFADQQHAGGGVPDVEIVFPEAVHPARRDPGEVERGGAEAAHARHFGRDRGVDLRPALAVAAAEVRNAGADQASR